MTIIPELPELPKLPEFTELSSFSEPLIEFDTVWLRMSDVKAVRIGYTRSYVFFLSGGETMELAERATTALLAYLEGGQDK